MPCPPVYFLFPTNTAALPVPAMLDQRKDLLPMLYPESRPHVNPFLFGFEHPFRLNRYNCPCSYFILTILHAFSVESNSVDSSQRERH